MRQERGGWSGGVLECWSAGVLECWSAGVLECWSAGSKRQLRKSNGLLEFPAPIYGPEDAEEELWFEAWSGASPILAPGS
jgi:hypothetical protein